MWYRKMNGGVLLALVLVAMPLWGQTREKLEPNQIKAREHFLQGVMDLKSSRMEEAKVQLERSYALWRDNPEIAYTLGKLYASMNQRTKAQHLFEQAYRADSTDTEYMQALVENLQKTDRLGEAISLQRAWLKRNPQDTEALYSLAYSLYAKGAYQEAYDIFAGMQTSGQEATEYAKLSGLKIRCLEALGQTDKAMDELLDLVQLHPELSEVKEELVEKLLDALRYDEALRFIDELEQEQGVRVSTLQFRLRYLLGKGEGDKGEALLRQILEIPEIELEEKLQMGRMWLIVQGKEQGPLPESYVRYFERLASLYPESVEARLVYGELLLREERYKEVLEVLAPLKQTAPETSKVWLMLLQSAIHLEDDALAVSICLEAIEALPLEYRFYQYGGIGLYSTKGKKEAMKLLQRGINRLLSEEIDEVGYLQGFLADIYMEEGKKKNAFALYDASLKALPSNAEVLNNYAYALAEDGIDLDKAERYASQAIGIDKENANYLDTYAWVLYKRGKYALAAFWQRKAIEFVEAGRGGVMYQHLGDIHLANGDKEAAREAYRKALSEYEAQSKMKESKEVGEKRLKSEAEIARILTSMMKEEQSFNQ